MKRRTKASKKRLNNLLVILLLTAVLLIMSTYAWFTANRTVKIDDIDVTVATSSGLQISVDGDDWKTVLTKDDIINAYRTYPTSINQLPNLMAPVSTSLEVEGNHLKMFYGSAEADLDPDHTATYGKYLLKSIKQEDVATNNPPADPDETQQQFYIAFDVFLKVETPADELYMTGSVVEPQLEKGLANASRVALIKGGTTGINSDLGTIQALPTNGDVMMWEPNNDTHTAAGVKNAKDLGWSSSLNEGEGNAPVVYDGLKDEFEGIILSDATVATSGADKFTTMSPTWGTPKTGIPSLQMTGGLGAGITKYRVYLWVEGQDVDCENNASGTDVAYALSFSLDPFQ